VVSITSEEVNKGGNKKVDIEQKPQIKLYVTARKDQKSIKLDKKIELVNVGTWGDQLSFGIHNPNWSPRRKNNKASIITIRENPGKIIRNFLDQMLLCYFGVGRKK
jgi:hypothetical protein